MKYSHHFTVFTKEDTSTSQGGAPWNRRAPDLYMYVVYYFERCIILSAFSQFPVKLLVGGGSKYLRSEVLKKVIFRLLVYYFERYF